MFIHWHYGCVGCDYVFVCFEELGALPRLFGAQIILIALWNLIFTVVLPDEKARTILGFDLYNISSYLLYGMTVLLSIGSVAMLFNKNNS
ncbi:hypothetical protein M3O75_31730 (plasmid) [Klebsiella pneumoniae]|nr:hypothetical protein [Klebsiella pneumoniae]